jgi:MFS transporter, CP family, cyanate transporter
VSLVRRPAWLQLLPLFLAALALRPQLVGIGPLLPFIQESLATPHAVGGLVSTIPVFFMGIFSLSAGWLVHRLGVRAAMTVALAMLVAFGVVRALSPDVSVLVASTVGVGIAIGLAGALLPAAVKVAVPAQAGLATGIYTIGIQLGAALSAAAAVPLALTIGWRGALLAFSVAIALLLGSWMTLGTLIPGRPRMNAPASRLPLRSVGAWHFAAILALDSVCFYGLTTWVPTMYVERGWTVVAAGSLVAILNGVALPASLVVPWLSDRTRQRGPYLVGAGGALALALFGLLVLPALAIGWVVVAGIALGALFPLALTLPVDRGSGGPEVAGYAAVTLAGGYGVASVGPVMVGWSRDLTGSFTVALAILVAAALGLVVLSLLLRRADSVLCQ